MSRLTCPRCQEGERFRLFCSTDTIAVVDRDGKVLTKENTFLRWCGHTPTECLSCHFNGSYKEFTADDKQV